MDRTRVTRRTAGLASLTATLLAGHLPVARDPGDVRRPAAVSPAGAPAASLPFAGLADAAPVPVPAAVDRAVRPLLAAPVLGGAAGSAAGYSAAGYVVDATTGTVLADENGARPAAPASTLKTAVATAALRALGPDTRLRTRVVRRGDTLWLVGGGDPTLTAGGPAAPTAPFAPARLADLAARVRAAGVTSVRTVVADGSAFTGPATGPGWKAGYVSGGSVTPVSAIEVDGGRSAPGSAGARTADPAGAAAAAFATALRAAGVAVTGTATGKAPAGATPVAAVDSPPVSALVDQMLTVSDNDLAESLGRLVARAAHRPATFAGATAAVLDQLTALRIPTAGASISDLSGLSPLDRIAPSTLVAILRTATAPAHPELRALLAGLPIAGFAGTLAGRYAVPATRGGAGVVRAKTGSLSTATSLAGVVVDADGRLLVFAFLAPVGESAASETALDRAAAALAGCGCRTG